MGRRVRVPPNTGEDRRDILADWEGRPAIAWMLPSASPTSVRDLTTTATAQASAISRLISVIANVVNRRWESPAIRTASSRSNAAVTDAAP